MLMQNSFVSQSPIETQKYARELISNLSGKHIIALIGDLGVGKTTFVQGVGESLGIKRMTSPTYTIIREYPILHATFERLYHLDLYRLTDKSEIDALGLQEIIDDPKALVLIEWPEKIMDDLENIVTTVKIINLDDTNRRIELI